VLRLARLHDITAVDDLAAPYIRSGAAR